MFLNLSTFIYVIVIGTLQIHIIQLFWYLKTKIFILILVQILQKLVVWGKALKLVIRFIWKDCNYLVQEKIDKYFTSHPSWFISILNSTSKFDSLRTCTFNLKFLGILIKPSNLVELEIIRPSLCLLLNLYFFGFICSSVSLNWIAHKDLLWHLC